MANFLFVYRGGGEAEAKMTPEQMQQMMQKWGAWIGEAMAKGWMMNPGDALTMEGRVVHANKVVTDGPFVESKEIVGGYSIVQADTHRCRRRTRQGLPGPALRRQGRGSAAGRVGRPALSRRRPDFSCTTDNSMSISTAGTSRSARGAFFPPRGGATGGRADPFLRLAELRPGRGNGAGHAAGRPAVVARSRHSR